MRPHALVAVDDLARLEHEGGVHEEHGVSRKQAVPDTAHDLGREDVPEGAGLALRQPLVHICSPAPSLRKVEILRVRKVCGLWKSVR